MSSIPLDDEERRVIFTKEVLSNLDDLDPPDQHGVVTRLLNIARSQAPPDEFIYERIRNIDVIREGDSCRLYTKIATNIPRGNTAYHIIYVLHVDADHDYHPSELAT